MVIQYDVVLSVINLTDDSTKRFAKTLEATIDVASDVLLYNNHHIIASNVYLLDMFKEEVKEYCTEQGILESSLQIDEFEMVSLTERTDVYFEFETEANEMSMKPTIKCYIYPKNDQLQIPTLVGTAYDSSTIIWTWPEDEQFAHYLVTDAINPHDKKHKDKIIAQLPIGTTSYTETNLMPDTVYTRRLINYTDEQTSLPSAPVSVQTETVTPVYSLEEYNVPRNYDFTTDDSERFQDKERFKAFHSGIGDFSDLKVYKQMDSDFYEKFKAYFEISGRRIERERRYEQVGFHYKICMEGMETIEEQEGETTFDVNVYPREWVILEDYMWATKPIKIKIKFQATVFLRKPIQGQEVQELKMYKPKYKKIRHTKKVPKGDPLNIIVVWDTSMSMFYTAGGFRGMNAGGVSYWDGTPQNCTLVNSTVFNNGQWNVHSQHFNTPFWRRFDNSDGHPNLDFYDAEIAMATIVDVIASHFAGPKGVLNTMHNKDKNGKTVAINSHIVTFCYNATCGHKAGTWRNTVSEICSYQVVTYTDAPGGVIRANYHYSKTSWVDGLNNAASYLSGLQKTNNTKNIVLFVSDGADNIVNSRAAITAAKNGLVAAGADIIIPVLADPHYNIPGGAYGHDSRYGGTSMYGRFATFNCNCMGDGLRISGAKGGSAIYPGECRANADVIEHNAETVLWGNANELRAALSKAIDDNCYEDYVYYTYAFDKWEEVPTDSTRIGKYSLDSVKAVTIQSDLLEFEINNTLTPAEYVRAEKRAIIPETSFLEKARVGTKTLYDLIMEKVRKTPEWLDGYKYTIGTVESDGQPDNFLIKGLYIWDSYEYNDQDNPITSATWGQEKLEDGMEGTVNVYTDIDKLGTSTYGDDCYLVTRNNYLMVQGYTDAIIYDGHRLVNTELNAYDRPTEVLVSAKDVYHYLLYNRKRPTLQCSSGVKVAHCIDVIRKDRDIELSGYKLAETNDYQVIDPFTKDLIGSIDKMYASPVLNYRFNLEDPDARTPLYEILPTCNPEDDFLHIVILHLYYVKNMWITNNNHYISQFANNPIATESSPYMDLEENFNKWTLKEWKDGVNKDNGWYIDDYLWFMAKPMLKTQKYYDEIPGPGMESLYGLVNGRYRTDRQDGKQDLRVDTPQFNVPTTVYKDSIRYYIQIGEFWPEDALVSYRWEHPYNGKDSVTQVNGDYVTFSSDNITYKDIEYTDIIATINKESQEIFDQKTHEVIYELSKPETIHSYKNYYLKISTDNSDVLAMRYPTEITFDENNKASIGVAFKGIVNATSRWSPRIHNGYYYLNQHEYYAYSECNIQANFDTYAEENFKTCKGYITFEVTLCHKAAPTEKYSITKDTRAELIQDENKFVWIEGKGLTLKPIIDGTYYKEYVSYVYESPVIMFKNILTSADKLKVDYNFTDGSSYLPLQVRSYNIADGHWSEWVPFTNNTVPKCPLSCAYQVSFVMQASVTNNDYFIEDYLCCYLDWKDDINEANTINIVTITDHMTVGPDEAPGTYISKIFDFGCVSQLALDIFESHYKDTIQVYIAFSDDNKNSLLIENCIWHTCIKNQQYSGRYFRYKIVIPYGEKLYWLHKKLQTYQTDVILPYLTGITMGGTYSPKDVKQNFINTEAVEIPKDGEYHIVFDRVLDVIGADIIERGFTEFEIEDIDISCTTSNMWIQYDTDNILETSIEAKSDIDVDIVIKNTPFIFTEQNNGKTVVNIIGTPQQYAPITVEDPDGNSFVQLYNKESFVQSEEYPLTDQTKYIELPTNRYDPLTLKIYLDGTEMDKELYNVVNHLVIFNDFITAGHVLIAEFCILYSFIPIIDRNENTTVIWLYTGEEKEIPKKVKVYFETNTRNNKFIANDLSLNPIYRTEYNGFIYLTDDHNEPYKINIYCNPLRLKAGGFDSVDIAVEVLDIKDNPIIAKPVAIDCQCGILTSDSYITDMNGVVHVVYESAYLKCTDKITVRVLKDNDTAIEQSIEIINE